MLLETLRASMNERAQRARGGVEPPDDIYKMMRIAYPGAFLVMLAEQSLGGAPPSGVLFAGATLFAAAKALKWWAIAALGRAWTFRVIVIPGAPLVASGPYRFVRHPNYVAVVGELVGAALMTRALVSGPIATALFGMLLRKRIAVEDRMLGRPSTVKIV
jgi:methyltransferase